MKITGTFFNFIEKSAERGFLRDLGTFGMDAK
jgi:hypothetical protein